MEEWLILQALMGISFKSNQETISKQLAPIQETSTTIKEHQQFVWL